ncbi:MAG: UbiA family prenyltransferase [Methanosarcinaceae archaeon]|nr:UbiA family prenyltransferase [Methanosarcinaceae archaeon]MDD4496703.1 UbiA family prenyltransferase [Methanosarcinaceae archaeon]
MNSNAEIGNFTNIFKHGWLYKYSWPDLSATLALLKSSALVAFSGALRVHLAFILLQVQSSLLTCIGGGLVVYTVYTLDRALESEEDSVNRQELNGSRRGVGLAVALLAFVAGLYLLAKEGIFMLAFLPFITGYLYSKGLKIGKFSFKLKGGLGGKNLVVGVTWGAFIAGLAGFGSDHLLPIFLVFAFFGVKLFINSTIYDFKDMKGDTFAGIRTLPVCLGMKNTRYLLTCLHLLSHSLLAFALVQGMIAFEPLIVLYSLFSGLICILNYTKQEEEVLPSQKIERTFLVDGESTSIVGLRLAARALMG